MEIAPEDTFNQVLCSSNDENQDVKKKMYNWWRAFFEVLGKVSDGKVPKDRVSEYNGKIDDLMAEIMKSGDASSEEGDVVSEGRIPDDSIRFGRGDIVDWDDPDTGERHRGWRVGSVNLDEFELFPPDGGKSVWVNEYYMDKVRKFNEDYEEADKADEDEMNKDFEFAVQHIGEIANKVKDVVNFVNPYCEKTFNEENITMKKPARYGIGDHVIYKGEECVVTDVDEDLRNDEEIYQVSRDSDKVDGLSFNYWATWDELEPVGEFTEEVKNTMKFKKIDERIGGGDSDEWVSMDDLIGKEVGESDNGETFWKAMDDVDDLERKGYWSGKFKVGDKVMWNDPEYDEWTDGWTVVSAPPNDDEEDVSPEDDIYTIENEDGSEAEVLGSELRPATMVNEASVVVDANDVWEVLDLLSDETANKNLTDLINSHVRTEEEIMDAIDTACGVETVTKDELNKLMTKNFVWIIDVLGLDVEKFKKDGQFVDPEKPVALESDWDEKPAEREEAHDKPERGTKAIVNGQEVDADSGYAEFMRIANMEPRRRHWEENSDDGKKMTPEQKKVVDNAKKTAKKDGYDQYIILDKEDGSWSFARKHIQDKSDFDKFNQEVVGIVTYDDLQYKPYSLTESEDEQKPDEIKDGEKKYKQDGETKTLDFGENKKPVCEMTIEQEVTDPWRLLELLWGQGKENFEELLRSNLFSDDKVMDTLEQFEVRDLTNLNDLLAYDFEQVLDAFGCDVEAWTQHLEIQKA